MNGDRHWTTVMFVERPDIFLPFLEERLAGTGKEVRAIKRILDSGDVPGDGRILDLCCGIGRHSVALAELGYEVVGIDIAPLFIEYATGLAKKRNVAKRIRFVSGDTRALLRLTKGLGKFDAAISMFTSFGYYDEKTDLKLFRDVSRVSKKGAVFVMETMNRDWLAKNFKKSGISSVKNIELHEFRKFDFAKSFIDNVWRFYRIDGEERWHLVTIQFSLKAYSPHELIKMLSRSGWKRADAYSEIGLKPLDFYSLSNRLVVVAQK